MAMMSLQPGVLFPTPGLVQMHTPVEVTATAHDLHQRFRRVSINGNDWPPDSPVARVYDVTNSASRLILLNNKLNKEQKKCHLRAKSAPSMHGQGHNVQQNDPERHFKGYYAPLARRHAHCKDSSSPRYKSPTTFSPSQLSTWVNSSTRPAVQYANSSSVKEWHHYSCDGTTNPSCNYPGGRVRHSSAGGQRARTAPPEGYRNEEYIQHPDLSLGQKLYLYEIARVYDMTKMKRLKQAQYIQLIAKEQARGFFSPDEYTRYLRYLGGPRKRQFGIQDPDGTNGALPGVVGNKLHQKDIKDEKKTSASPGGPASALVQSIRSSSATRAAVAMAI